VAPIQPKIDGAAGVYHSAMLPRHVYVHVPFCARRCSYCDFAIAVRRRVPVDEYVRALGAELALRYPAAERWEAETLYFGGGTPSRLRGDGIARTLELLRSRIALAPGAEVTIEANPEDVTPEAARAWRAAGVNRLSLGSQSFDDRVLVWMHRTHAASRITEAVEAARGAGIENLSLDLIFALPDALDRSWTADLERALALQPAHLSLYGLTVESGTPLGRWRDRGDVTEPPEERYEHEFLEAHERLAGAGYEHYEVSNFARAESRSRHNASYWSGAAYAGLGPGAHEFDGRTRRWNVGAYADWVRRVDRGEDPTEGNEQIDGPARVAEAVYLGLRTTDGLDLLPGEEYAAGRWADAGWARIERGRLRLTPVGWLRMDALAADLTYRRSR
jgi:oxygen-independent coproporphyrinogen-3 oxidase